MSQWIANSTRYAIYHRDAHRCVYCGARASDGVQLSLDHVVARELGGGNEASNLVTSCIHCNSSKKEQPLASFLRRLADLGISTDAVRSRIRRAVRRPLDRAEGRRLAAG